MGLNGSSNSGSAESAVACEEFEMGDGANLALHSEIPYNL